MQPTTIAEVVNHLHTITQQCAGAGNRAGYFAALYKRMTMAVGEGIAKGAFEDGPRMEKLDVVFAQRYLDAWRQYGAKMPCSISWKLALDGCADKNLTVIQHLLLGINTHINLDLAVAAAIVAPGEKIHALEKDFNRINDMIASLVDDVQYCLEQVWFPMRWIKRISNRQQQDVLNFSISIARKTAWANAVLLAQLNNEMQVKHIQTMDNMVLGVGKKIMHPGTLSAMLLWAVRLTEFENIGRTIRLIDTVRIGT